MESDTVVGMAVVILALIGAVVVCVIICAGVDSLHGRIQAATHAEAGAP